MATLSKGYTFGATETVTNTKLHNLVDLGSISGIVNADVSASADIDSTKLDLATAGYLTTGGNFDVTGRHSHADLTWFNTSSLASISDVRIQSMVLSSLASLAEARIDDGYAQTMLIPSLASIADARVAELNAPLAHIYSLASLANPLHYTAFVSSLASGAMPQYDGSTEFVGLALVAGSNILFQYVANVSNTGSNAGEITGTSLNPTGGTGNYRFHQKRSTSYVTVWQTKFTKVSNIKTVTIYGQVWNQTTGGSRTASLKVDIGGQNGEATGTADQTTPEWVNFTIDVSSLTDSTVYDVTVQIKTSSATNNHYLGNLVAFGS